MGKKPRYTWQQAVIRWIKEQSHKKSIKTDIELMRWLDTYLSDKYLDEICAETVRTIQQAKIDTGVKNGTVNRIMAQLRSVLNKAEKEWLWIDKAPCFRMLPNANKRIRWLSHVEAKRLLNELPEHLESMARFALSTGL